MKKPIFKVVMQLIRCTTNWWRVGSFASSMSQRKYLCASLQGSYCFLRYKMNALLSFCPDGLHPLGCCSSPGSAEAKSVSRLSLWSCKISLFCGFLEEAEWLQTESRKCWDQWRLVTSSGRGGDVLVNPISILRKRRHLVHVSPLRMGTFANPAPFTSETTVLFSWKPLNFSSL